MMETKVCTKCREEKPLGAFNRLTRGKGGRSARCKECARAYQRQYRAEHPEKSSEWSRRYYERHREAVLERTHARHRQVTEEGVTRGALYMRATRAHDPEKHRAYQREQKRRWRAAKRAERGG